MGYCGRLWLQLVGARPTLSGRLETRRLRAMEVTKNPVRWPECRGYDDKKINKNKDAAGIQITAPKIRESRAFG